MGIRNDPYDATGFVLGGFPGCLTLFGGVIKKQA
jgi:hypothetical protein